MVDGPDFNLDIAYVGDADGDEPTITEAEPLGPGSEVGGYVIDGELGRGGMGVVYSAVHPVIGKRAAVKVLRPEVSTSRTTVERFIQEARAVNQIGHPNIIDIFAFGEHTDGRAYHIMDLLVGEPLRARLKRGALHPSEVASVIEEIASALSAAHDKGFVHRDLKPDNVYLVTHDGRWPEVKLLDFGLCKLMPESGLQAPFRTKTGLMLGTPEYMAPEQARGKPVDYRTDIYALGVLTFEILTGRRPFASGKTAFETLQAHAREAPPSIALLLPQLPAELVQLVETMLAKHPDDRPSLAAVRTVIKRLRSTQLPSRTMAGLEMSALQSGSPSSGGVTLAPLPTHVPSLSNITPSRLGAEPMPTMAMMPSFSPAGPSGRAPTQPPGRSPTQPPAMAPAPYDPRFSGPVSLPPAPVGPYAHPGAVAPRYGSVPPLADPTVLQSRHGSISPVSNPGQPHAAPASFGARPATGTDHASGLRGDSLLAATSLGIGPPKVSPPAKRPAGLEPPRHEKLNPIIIIVVAIGAIGVGIGLALAAVG